MAVASKPYGRKEIDVFNRDGLFGKKDENPRSDLRPVNVTPGLSGAAPAARPQVQPQSPLDTPKPDLRFAETPKASAAARLEEAAGSRLIVGPDIKLKGVEITDCDTLVVEGRVEASMDSRVVQIAENGVFSGTVSIDVAEIRGVFEGELTARKQLVIFSTGRVSGRIRYGKIRIEEGGEISGEVSTLVTPAPVRQQPAAAAAAPAPAAIPAAAAAPAPVAAAAPAPIAAAPVAIEAETPVAVVSTEPLTVRPVAKQAPKTNAGVNTV
jgi:cytoskeletal protein CcmA (bactofilin family)